MSMALQEYKPETEILFHKKIRFHPELTFGEKMFLAEVESLSKNKTCPYSSRKMSEYFGVSHQTILNWVKKLVFMDLIEINMDYKNVECRHFIRTKIKK